MGSAIHRTLQNIFRRNSIKISGRKDRIRNRTVPEGELFDYAASELKTLGRILLMSTTIRNQIGFSRTLGRYDNYDRNSYKIFAGEFAAQSVATVSPENKNTWLCALSEAAFMTGLERNADVVYMASYAPLFAHTEGWQWTPDLIWFDNLSAYGTPNYYVQKLFAPTRGHILRQLRLMESPLKANRIFTHQRPGITILLK
jgi:alpha-N-arabinofuranosidase